jgi:DNA-binding MarR family transcriptional regulator
MIGMIDEVDEIVAAWHRERPDLDVEPLHVLSRVSRLADVLAERRSDAFVEHGLQAHEFDVLTALRRVGEPFELTAGELSALTHVTSGTMTSRLDRLTARKFVTRHPDPSDGRLVRVRLSATGRKRVDAAFAALLRSERELTAHLSDAERTALVAALRHLLASALAPGPVPERDGGRIGALNSPGQDAQIG